MVHSFCAWHNKYVLTQTVTKQWKLRVLEAATTQKLDRQTDRQAGRQADRQAGRQAGRQADRQAGRQTDRQTDRQTGKQTDANVRKHCHRKVIRVLTFRVLTLRRNNEVL